MHVVWLADKFGRTIGMNVCVFSSKRAAVAGERSLVDGGWVYLIIWNHGFINSILYNSFAPQISIATGPIFHHFISNLDILNIIQTESDEILVQTLTLVHKPHGTLRWFEIFFEVIPGFLLWGYVLFFRWWLSEFLEPSILIFFDNMVFILIVFTSGF